MPPSILVIDDDSSQRRVLVAALVDAGYAVDDASDGLLALTRIAQQMPDLILADVHLPGLGGIGLATILAPHTPAIPIILMSANPLPSGCAYPFLRKPFEIDALLTFMARTAPTSGVAATALAGLRAV